jgi:hypothetical protein
VKRWRLAPEDLQAREARREAAADRVIDWLARLLTRRRRPGCEQCGYPEWDVKEGAVVCAGCGAPHRCRSCGGTRLARFEGVTVCMDCPAVPAQRLPS